MRKIIVACIVSMAIFTCCTTGTSSSSKEVEEKKYLYVEVSATNSMGVYRTKIDTVEILEKNDSLAYLKAFEKICVSQKASMVVAEQLKKAMGSKYEPYEDRYDFRLLNENLKEVDQTVVPDSILAAIAERIFSLKTD